MTPATLPMAKGAVVRSTLEFVAERVGAGARDAVLARLSPAVRETVTTVSATAEVPFAVAVELWDAVDAVVGGEWPSWPEEAGARSIESVGVQLYGGILRKSSPELFLTQNVSLFRLYYQPGDMEVVEVGANSAVLRLVGFDHDTRIFCRRQTGGLARALEIAGGSSPSVRHVRCATEGDAFCEWAMRWDARPGE